MLLAKLGVEPPDHVVMGVKERLPCAELGFVELRSHWSEVYQRRTCARKYLGDKLRFANIAAPRIRRRTKWVECCSG